VSLKRSTCFWSPVISSKLRLTAFVIEAMVVKRAEEGYVCFGCACRDFIRSDGDRGTDIRHCGAYDDNRGQELECKIRRRMLVFRGEWDRGTRTNARSMVIECTNYQRTRSRYKASPSPTTIGTFRVPSKNESSAWRVVGSVK
jgi:hypothetical protein